MSVYDDQNYRLYQGDACYELGVMSRACEVDLVITDPAYAALEKHRVKPNGKPRGTTVRLSESEGSSNKWFPIFPDSRYPELFDLYYRSMADDAHLYMMCAADLDQMNVMVAAGRGAGFKFWKAIPWDKGRAGMGYHWRASHEYILFFEKGKKRLNCLGWRDWLHASEMDEEERKADPQHLTVPGLRTKGLYPTEKPARLWTVLIENSSKSGDLVLDSFCGSGSSGEAALMLNRRYIGMDIEADAIERTWLRCKKALAVRS